jgi:hypothetical protein
MFSSAETVALVQHPPQGAPVVGRGDGAAGRAVEAASPELRLAVRAQVREAAVGLEHLDELEGPVHRSCERLGPDSLQPVRRGVVAGELGVRCAHEAADGQVEPRRAELALVAAPRLPRQDPIGAPESRSTSSIARSTAASPRLLRSSVKSPLSPMQDNIRPCSMRSSRSRF